MDDAGKVGDGRVDKFTKRRRVMKNVMVLSCSLLLLFTSFAGLANIQSSLHHEQGMGVICSSILYASMTASALFLPGLLISRLGHKWTLCLSVLGYITWMAANGYASWFTMVPASVVAGLLSATLWSAQGAYLTDVARAYARATNIDEDNFISKVFSIFFTVFQFYCVPGGIISSLVLHQHRSNSTSTNSSEKECGASFCPAAYSNATVTQKHEIEMTLVWILVGTYVGLAFIALLLMIFFLDNFSGEEKKRVRPACASLTRVIGNLRNRKQIALVPLSAFVGMYSTVLEADFNLAFVTCSVGIGGVGLVSISYSVMGALSSLGVGVITPVVGRPAAMLFVVVLGLAIQVTLLLWIPTPETQYVLYIISGLWGMVNTAVQTQINTMYGISFPGKSETGFASYQLWKSLGRTITFGYSFFFCSSTKLHILTCVLVVGAAGYLLVEQWNKTEAKQSKKDNADVSEKLTQGDATSHHASNNNLKQPL